ncbi:MAG: hypothetical protein PUB22_05055 [Clostridiales bacterium]|nr:hypothetical protein [Clostridiales bacterium]
MTKALLKKQMMEVFAWIYKNRKTGKLRSKQGMVGYIVLYLLLFALLGSVFFVAAITLCEPLVMSGLGWFYWCLMGLISVFFGVFGSVFNTYASLYQAKDNDFLLSMPIPTSRILLARMVGVYAMGLMYLLIVIVPTIIVWFMTVSISVSGLICVLLISILLSILILVLAAVLGWAVALIAGKLKHKNLVTVFASLVFIGAYYYFYARASVMLQDLLRNAENVSNQMKIVLYPLYHMGLAAEGNWLSMMFFAACVLAVFGIVYAVLSFSFLKLATTNRGAARKAYKEQAVKVRSIESALLQKELRRFLGSSNYMLNCGLGILFMPLGAAALVWKAADVRMFLELAALDNYIPLIAAAGIGVVATMNDITAPSVSLEGKSLWLVQVFPVTAKQALTAKLKLHLLLTVIPAIPLIAVVEWLLAMTPFYAIFVPVVSVLFIFLMAVLGLVINLKMPNLNWTNEIVPIKQSMGVMFALFGGWVIIIVSGVLYVLVKKFFGMEVYFVLISLLMLMVSGMLYRWLMTKGADIFQSLA